MPLHLPLLAPADWSIVVRDAVTDEILLGHQASRQLRTASIGKVFLLIEVARLADQGELDLEERLSWQDDEWVADSGLLYLLGQEDRTVADLCVLVGAVSDNLATNVLVRRIGIDAIARMSRGLDCQDSALLDRIRANRDPQDPPTLSVGTAAELSLVMARLHRGQVVNVSVSARVLRWLAAGSDLSMVAAAFDLDPLAHAEPDRGITVVNKTGTISTARIDIGTVSGPAGTVAYAVGANWAAGTDLRDDVLGCMRSIGSAIRAHVSGR